MGLEGFTFEEDVLRRSQVVSLTDEIKIRVVCPEDLIAMKVFAGRERDWEDVRGILVRQGKKLDWQLVDQNLPMLLELIEEPNCYARLIQLRTELG